jgi:hypothetical protein
MLSRALSLATVMLLIGFAAVPAQAQNLEAGKTPSQIFSGSCAVCHKSPRGLLKTVAPGSLPGFLRQHYTTSTDMASLLSAYVISNGATDTRYGGGGLTKQGKELTTEQKPSEQKPGAAPAPADEPSLFGFGRRKREAPPQEAAKPNADGLSAQSEPGTRQGHNAKRSARPAAETPDAAKPAVEGKPPAAAEDEPAVRPSQKQKLGKKGRRGREEPAKTDDAKDEPKSEPAKAESKAEPKSEPAKPDAPKEEASKPAAVKPADEVKPETAKPEAAKPESVRSEPKVETPPLRADPVPAVTPAPKAPEPESRPARTEAAPPAAAPTPAPAVLAPPPAAAVPSPAPEPVAPPAPVAKPTPPPAAASPASSGPPAPPISQ